MGLIYTVNNQYIQNLNDIANNVKKENKKTYEKQRDEKINQIFGWFCYKFEDAITQIVKQGSFEIINNKKIIRGVIKSTYLTYEDSHSISTIVIESPIEICLFEDRNNDFLHSTNNELLHFALGPFYNESREILSSRSLFGILRPFDEYRYTYNRDEKATTEFINKFNNRFKGFAKITDDKFEHKYSSVSDGSFYQRFNFQVEF